MTSIIHLYAELLLNIRAVTLTGTVQNDQQPDSNIEIIYSDSSIVVKHANDESVLNFPIVSFIEQKTTLPISVGQARNFSCRAAVKHKVPNVLASLEHLDEKTPLSAASLKAKSGMYCAQCRTSIVSPAVIHSWRDLPSENWAEMMDFWHCHKPQDHSSNQEGDALLNKGYAASKRLSSIPLIGLVDPMSILFSRGDCIGVAVSFFRA